MAPSSAQASGAPASAASSAVPEPWLVLPGLPPWALGFAVRTILALLLSYWIAFWIQLDSAASAGICVALVVQPQRGQALSKALYRIGGTLIGAVAAVAATAIFPQNRTMLLAVLVVWLAACTFAASLLRDFRAYGATLAGYTLAIISITQIDAPQMAFLTALDRVAAIVIGVVCVAEVNGAFGRPDASLAVNAQLRCLLEQVTEHALGALTGGPSALSGIAGAEQGAAILALRTQTTYIATELQDGPVRASGARSAIAALIGMLSASDVIAAARMRDEADPITRAALDRAAGALREPGGNGELPPNVADRLDCTLPQALLLDRTSDLLEQHALALDGIDSLATGRRPARQVRLPAYHDTAGALLNALRTIIAVSLASAFSIYAGWSGATLMLVQISALVALLGQQPNPARAAFMAMLAVPVGLACAAVAKYGLLPEAYSYVQFSLAVTPFVFAFCTIGWHPRLAGLGSIVLLFFLLALAPSNPQTYDPVTFLNTALSVAAAIVATFLGFSVVLPVSPPRRLFRVADAITRDLSRTLRHGCRLDQPALLSLQYDRLAAALIWLGRRTPARLAMLTHLRALGELDVLLCRAHASLDETVRHAPALGRAAEQARAALRRPAPDEVSAAAARLLVSAQAAEPAPRPAIRAAAAMYGASLLLRSEHRLIALAGICGG